MLNKVYVKCMYEAVVNPFEEDSKDLFALDSKGIVENAGGDFSYKQE